MNTLITRPEIAIEDFLPIFVESSLVLIFGVAYAGVITLSKMGYFSSKWSILGYIFWIIQTYLLYDFAMLIQSNHFTMKVLMVTMVIYLFIPHLYFQLVSESESRYEKDNEEEEELKTK